MAVDNVRSLHRNSGTVPAGPPAGSPGCTGPSGNFPPHPCPPVGQPACPPRQHSAQTAERQLLPGRGGVKGAGGRRAWLWDPLFPSAVSCVNWGLSIPVPAKPLCAQSTDDSPQVCPKKGPPATSELRGDEGPWERNSFLLAATLSPPEHSRIGVGLGGEHGCAGPLPLLVPGGQREGSVFK